MSSRVSRVKRQASRENELQKQKIFKTEHVKFEDAMSSKDLEGRFSKSMSLSESSRSNTSSDIKEGKDRLKILFGNFKLDWFFQHFPKFSEDKKMMNIKLENAPIKGEIYTSHIHIFEGNEKKYNIPMHPGNIMNTILPFNNVFQRNMSNKNLGTPYPNFFILMFLNYCELNVLYIEVDKIGMLYLSPLNSEDFRKNKNKSGHISEAYNELFNEYDRQLEIVINPSHYDLIVKHGSDNKHILPKNGSSQNNDVKIKIKMHGRSKCYYTSSILYNGNKNHAVSVFKCNGQLYLNTTWGRDSDIENGNSAKFKTIKNNDFIIGERAYFKINEHNAFQKISEKELKSESYYTSGFEESIRHDKFEVCNLHFFTTTKLTKYISKRISSNNTEQSYYIKEALNPDTKNCSIAYMPFNDFGFCWFSSMLTSFLYSDEISILILKSILKNIKIGIENTLLENEFLEMSSSEFVDTHLGQTGDQAEHFAAIDDFMEVYIKFVFFIYISNLHKDKFMNSGTLIYAKMTKKWMKNLFFIQSNSEIIKACLQKTLSHANTLKKTIINRKNSLSEST
jgi:hypothetical protein